MSVTNVQYRSKVVINKDHVGSFLRHIGSGFSHRDADVGASQSNGVINTIARHADDVSCVL